MTHGNERKAQIERMLRLLRRPDLASGDHWNASGNFRGDEFGDGTVIGDFDRLCFEYVRQRRMDVVYPTVDEVLDEGAGVA